MNGGHPSWKCDPTNHLLKKWDYPRLAKRLSGLGQRMPVVDFHGSSHISAITKIQRESSSGFSGRFGRFGPGSDPKKKSTDQVTPYIFLVWNTKHHWTNKGNTNWIPGCFDFDQASGPFSGSWSGFGILLGVNCECWMEHLGWYMFLFVGSLLWGFCWGTWGEGILEITWKSIRFIVYPERNHALDVNYYVLET